MVSPNITPEDGIARYSGDATQGPACAIACAAGTIYRNYFMPLGDQTGQSQHRQIDCLSAFGAAVGNDHNTYWTMRNGYALSDPLRLTALNATLKTYDNSASTPLMGTLKIGIQSKTEVTSGDTGHLVTQAYCSALPIAYCDASNDDWEPFARLVLKADNTKPASLPRLPTAPKPAPPAFS